MNSGKWNIASYFVYLKCSIHEAYNINTFHIQCDIWCGLSFPRYVWTMYKWNHYLICENIK